MPGDAYLLSQPSYDTRRNDFSSSLNLYHRLCRLDHHWWRRVRHFHYLRCLQLVVSGMQMETWIEAICCCELCVEECAMGVLTSLLISLCGCCKLCTVGWAVLVTVTDGVKLCVCCCGTDTGVLLTGGCCFFLNESCKWNETFAISKIWFDGRQKLWVNQPYSILSISHLELGFHRNRIRNGTWAALDLIRAPLSRKCYRFRRKSLVFNIRNDGHTGTRYFSRKFHNNFNERTFWNLSFSLSLTNAESIYDLSVHQKLTNR